MDRTASRSVGAASETGSAGVASEIESTGATSEITGQASGTALAAAGASEDRLGADGRWQIDDGKKDSAQTGKLGGISESRIIPRNPDLP